MPHALIAGFWGAVAGAALLIGAVIGYYAPASRRVIALIMGVGGGVLISLVAFSLMDEAYARGGLKGAALGMVLGALTFFGADLLVAKKGGKHRKRPHHQKSGSGVAIFVGSMLDSIPEAIAIGVSMIGGGAVGWVTVAGVFLSNVPEGLSAATGMKHAGRSVGYVMGLWGAAMASTAVAAALGYWLLSGAPDTLIATIQSFAAGAVLAMLASTMLPEAVEGGGPVVGLVTSLGFLAAFALSKLQ